MNELTSIYKNQPVRIMERNGETWFVAKDVSEILGYSDTQAMTRRLDEDETGTCTDDSSGQVRHIIIVNEPGLYNAILGSKKSEAKDFKRWVTHDVLPSIRRTGSYNMLQPSLSVMDVVDSINTCYRQCLAENAMLREKNAYLEQFAPKNEYGDLNANGKPKVFQRKGCYVTAKGTEPQRMDPDKKGYLELDLFLDYLPTKLLDKLSGFFGRLANDKREQESGSLPGGE